MKDSLRRESVVDIQEHGDPYWFNNPQYRLSADELTEVGHFPVHMAVWGLILWEYDAWEIHRNICDDSLGLVKPLVACLFAKSHTVCDLCVLTCVRSLRPHVCPLGHALFRRC